MKLTAKKTAPYRYLAPTILLMIVFMVIPICMVIGYSFVDGLSSQRIRILSDWQIIRPYLQTASI